MTQYGQPRNETNRQRTAFILQLTTLVLVAVAVIAEAQQPKKDLPDRDA